MSSTAAFASDFRDRFLVLLAIAGFTYAGLASPLVSGRRLLIPACKLQCGRFGPLSMHFMDRWKLRSTLRFSCPSSLDAAAVRFSERRYLTAFRGLHRSTAPHSPPRVTLWCVKAFCVRPYTLLTGMEGSRRYPLPFSHPLSYATITCFSLAMPPASTLFHSVEVLWYVIWSMGN